MFSAVNTENESELVSGSVGCGRQEGQITITADDLIADEAQVAEQLMVVRFAVGEAAFLVVPMAQERLLALGANEVLDVPVLAERGDDALLDGPAAGAADRDAHLVVAAQAVELVHVVRREARAALHLAGRRVELDVARGAVEVVAVVDLSAEPQRLVVDDSTKHKKQ